MANPSRRPRTREELAPEVVWQAALAQWRIALSGPAFGAWIQPTRLLDLGSPTTRIAVPSALAKNWIEDRLAEDMEVTLSEMLGAAVSLEITVDPSMMAAANSVTDPEPVVESGKILPLAPALMEYNLSRRGIWDTQVDREQLKFQYVAEDIEGEITIDLSSGRLSTAEMELTAWILGRWEHGRPVVTFNCREYARDCGVAWAGWRGKSIRQQLKRVAGARFSTRVWSPKTQQREERFFGILDDAKLRDKASSIGASFSADGKGTISVRLSTFLIEQLEAGQFVPLDWRLFRGVLQTPLQRRLYVFLEGQKGFGPSGDYEITIDEKFLTSIGMRDDLTNHGSRLRAAILAAGEVIVEADARYVSISIRPGRTRRWVLVVKRRPRRPALKA